MPFVYDNSIYNCFVQLLTENQYSRAQKTLFLMEFPSIITSEIKGTKLNIELKRDEQYLNKDIIKVANLFRIISLFSQTKKMDVGIQQHIFFNFLFEKMQNYPEIIENARWTALCSLYTKKTKNLYSPFISQVIFYISEPYTYLNESRVSALSLLTKMMKNDGLVSLVLDETGFCQVILRLYEQFPENTFLHNQIYEFVENALKTSAFGNSLVKSLLPQLLISCNGPERNAHKSSSHKIIHLIYQQSKKNKNLKQILDNEKSFNDVMNNSIIPLRNIYEDSYGII